MRIILALLLSAIAARSQTTNGIIVFDTGTNNVVIRLYHTNLDTGTSWIEIKDDFNNTNWIPYKPVVRTNYVTVSQHVTSKNIPSRYYRTVKYADENFTSDGEEWNSRTMSATAHPIAIQSQTEQLETYDPLPEATVWYHQQWTVINIPRNPLPPRR